MRTRPLAVALVLALASGATAAVLELANGDRISGRITLRGKTTVRVKTPYGQLVVPKKDIAYIQNDDGTREALNPPPTPPPTPPPLPPRLEVQVKGDAFWYAWDPKNLPSSTAVALRLRLDDTLVASFADEAVDPNEIKGAVVNAFAFTQDVLVRPGDGVRVKPPTGATLTMDLPPGTEGGLLRLSYVVQPAAGDAEPVEVAAGTVRVHLVPGRTTRVRVEQGRGAMEWSRKRVQGADTFRIQAESTAPETPGTP